MSMFSRKRDILVQWRGKSWTSELWWSGSFPLCLAPTQANHKNLNKQPAVSCKHTHNTLTSWAVWMVGNPLAALHTYMTMKVWWMSHRGVSVESQMLESVQSKNDWIFLWNCLLTKPEWVSVKSVQSSALERHCNDGSLQRRVPLWILRSNHSCWTGPNARLGPKKTKNTHITLHHTHIVDLGFNNTERFNPSNVSTCYLI